VADSKLVTADELLKMGDIGPCELIDGRIVKTDYAGMEEGLITTEIGCLLFEFVKAHQLGTVLARGTGYLVSTNPESVRCPDRSFVRKSRLPKRPLIGYFNGAPDLAVEVIFPDDTKREVSAKTNMWLAHGTTSVWVADPTPMTITIHRTGKPPIRLNVQDEVCDEPALPCFVMPLAKVFTRT
jgi:Uma2 family endonuclease